jgi:hypothetical protein
MQKSIWTVLVVCWGALSTAVWKVCQPAIHDWAAQALTGRVDANQTDVIAFLLANGLPFVAVAAAMLLVLLLARLRNRRNAAQQPAAKAVPLSAGQTNESTPSHRGFGANRTADRKIYIKPPKILVHSGARFGVLLANGDQRSQPNTEIYFRKLDDRGTLMAQVPRDGRRFTCFVDYRGLKSERVERALMASRFTLMAPQTDENFRAWFLPPPHTTSHTTGTLTNLV